MTLPFRHSARRVFRRSCICDRHPLLSYLLPTSLTGPAFSTSRRLGAQLTEEMPQLQLKVPKGTKDWEGKDMVIRDKIFSTITQVFKRHGAVTVDTSVITLRIIFKLLPLMIV